jgi:CO/xanthine dehydrogenase FAD-binding subunit
MIKGYFRPKTIHEAVELLQQNERAIPIGGGTSLNKIVEDIVVVDLQDLNLSDIKNGQKEVIIGSLTTLEKIKEFFDGNETIRKVLKIEGSKNQRTQSSLGGFLKLAGGRSPLLTCLLTLNCTIFFALEENGMPLSEFLDKRKSSIKLITQITISKPDNLVFESISRSPLDIPIVCCAVTRLNSELKAAVGGFGEKPQIVPETYFLEKNLGDITTYLRFISDEWASANYRANITQILLKRLIDLTKKGKQ